MLEETDTSVACPIARRSRRPSREPAHGRTRQRERHRARGGRRRKLPAARAGADRAARDLGGQRLDHHRHAARRDHARHRPARACPRSQRHSRQDRHDPAGARCLVLRFQSGPGRYRLGGIRPGAPARPRRGRIADRAADVDLLHARCARRCPAAPAADAGRRRHRARCADRDAFGDDSPREFEYFLADHLPEGAPGEDGGTGEPPGQPYEDPIF